MSVELLVPVRTRPLSGSRFVVAFRTARKAVRSGALWGYVFGLTVASSALGFASTYKTTAQRSHFAELFGFNSALAAINGPARRIQTVAGYTVWKSSMFLVIVGAVWGLSTSTKLLRGEEDSGHWELFLAGATTRRRCTAEALSGLAAGLLCLWSITATITVIIGHTSSLRVSTAAALFFAVVLAAPAALFLAVGAFTSQIAATRRQAAGYAAGALGICYALRLVADSGSGLQWLRWTTPLGWVEELQPFTDPRPLVLLPIASVTAVLAIAAVHLAGSRDLGASVIPDSSCSRPHTALLFGPAGLALRLVRPVATAWAVAISASALLMGFISKQGGVALTSSPSIEQVVSRMGASGGGASAYLGFTFVIVAAMVALVAASLVAATRAEEAEGRLENLLVRPVSRSAWILRRMSLVFALVLGDGLIAGLAAWMGAASQHAGVSFGGLVAAGVNLVAPALCIAGAGALFLGIWPRASVAATYGLLAWSLVVELVGGLFTSNHWVLDTSVFHQIAAAPAVDPRWVSWGVLFGVAALCCVVGAAVFRRRDLAAE